MSTQNQGADWGHTAKVGFIGLLIVAGGVGLCMAIEDSSKRAVAPVASAPPPPQPIPVRPSNREFRAYMAALAPVVMTAVNTTDCASACTEEEGAPGSAREAAECLHRALLLARESNASVRAITAPTDMIERHAELVAISNDAVTALDVYARAFDGAAARLDRLRHRRSFREFYAESELEEVATLHGQAEGTARAWDRWERWIHPMNVQCNERLRCFGAWGRAVGGTPPPDFTPRVAAQVNCGCPRIWNSLRGESHEAILTAEESGLPPFRGGIL